MQHRQRARRELEGTTLIELMVVIVIMTAIASAVAIGVMKSWTTARINDTKTRARTLQAATSAYLLAQGGGDCPRVEDLERAQVLDPTTQHTDAWDRPFTIECDEVSVHVRSPGPDAELGTDDDVGF